MSIIGGVVLARGQELDDEYGGNRTLTILVPRKVGFQQFANVSCSPDHGDNGSTGCTFLGFAVEVFNTCIRNLSPRRTVHFQYVPFGDGVASPIYNDMVHALKNKEAHGIVADLTITAERMEDVDFSHPYIQSTLVMIEPYRDNPASKHIWSFMKPFSLGLWISILGLFISTGLVIFTLERNNPYFHQQGLHWRHRLANVFWFTSLTLFFAQKADISTKLGRVQTVFWLLVLLVFMSTYTASLASILSSQKNIEKYESFADVQKNANLTIGSNNASFLRSYIEENLNIKRERLKLLSTEQDYEKSLQNQSVDVILHELPYVQIFLNRRCQYTKAKNQIAYFGGFGYAFRKNSSLTLDISLEILKLEQSGVLESLRDQLLGTSKCNSINDASTIIPLKYFGGLFIIILSIYTLCILLRFVTWL